MFKICGIIGILWIWLTDVIIHVSMVLSSMLYHMTSMLVVYFNNVITIKNVPSSVIKNAFWIDIF